MAKRAVRPDQAFQDAIRPHLRALSHERGAQADLARFLDVTPATVAQWKARSVPAKYRDALIDWYARRGTDLRRDLLVHTGDQELAGGMREAETRALERQTRHALHAAIVNVTKRINREFSELVALVDRLERADGLLGTGKPNRVSRRR